MAVEVNRRDQSLKQKLAWVYHSGDSSNDESLAVRLRLTCQP